MTPDSDNTRNTWERVQAQTGLTRAAFAILKGQPVPNDPIYGKPYRWNPVTRKLSGPDVPAYKNPGLKSMIVPKLKTQSSLPDEKK